MQGRSFHFSPAFDDPFFAEVGFVYLDGMITKESRPFQGCFLH